MDEQQDRDLLVKRLGTSSPGWRLSGDSNALEFAADSGETHISSALSSDQVAQIRCLTGVTSYLLLEVTLFGSPLRLHLIGKKVGLSTWAGTASAHTDTESVARDLSRALALAEQVVSEVNSLVAIIDRNGIVQRFNRICEEVTGMREEDVIGRSAFELFMSPDQAAQSRFNIDNFYENKRPYAVERYINTVNGPRLYTFRNTFVRSGGDEQFLICAGTDITEARDAVTGLPNRYAINEKIKSALTTANEYGTQIGLLFLDLDNFKRVNDRHGHVLGDRLLQTVSEIVKRELPGNATLARLSGDEFLVLFEDTTSGVLEAAAQRILESVRKPLHVDRMEISTSCSIGIAIHPQHGETPESLIRSADTAMCAAKEAGKHTYRLFTVEMNRKVAEYMWLNTSVPKALEEEQFVLHYQPLVNLATGKVQSVEALIRWNSTERGMVPPADFIPYAEESGLIGPLGRWVMGAAASQAAQWKANGLDVRVSINVSARQLRDVEIIRHFANALESVGVQPGLLDIELTESCFIDDEDTARSLMDQFRQLGARICLDDFGTGYSSLSYLSRLPLDVIKLDRSFITGIDSNKSAQALVRSMVAIARALAFSVVAEGVETASEAEFLKHVGIEYAQGYLYARPMPAVELEAWLAENSLTSFTSYG
jgi:cyclic di-GMP phosphodiesterase Gmr